MRGLCSCEVNIFNLVRPHRNKVRVKPSWGDTTRPARRRTKNNTLRLAEKAFTHKPRQRNTGLTVLGRSLVQRLPGTSLNQPCPHPSNRKKSQDSCDKMAHISTRKVGSKSCSICGAMEHLAEKAISSTQSSATTKGYRSSHKIGSVKIQD